MSGQSIDPTPSVKQDTKNVEKRMGESRMWNFMGAERFSERVR
jgi:hypothetical protein